MVRLHPGELGPPSRGPKAAEARWLTLSDSGPIPFGPFGGEGKVQRLGIVDADQIAPWRER